MSSNFLILMLSDLHKTFCFFCFPQIASFEELSGSIYIVYVKANTSTLSIKIPENVTQDVAGNKNLASNILKVKHCKCFNQIICVIKYCNSVSLLLLMFFISCT